jgi:hypothetical protein
MNQDGYNAVNQALEPIRRASILDVSILPPLNEVEYFGEEYNERYFEIEFSTAIHNYEVIRNLGSAGLMERTSGKEQISEDMPELKILGIVPGRILFEDLAHKD